MAAVVIDKIEFGELNRVLKKAMGRAPATGNASCWMNNTHYICLITVPAAIPSIIRGLRGSPKATIGDELVETVAKCRRLRIGSARPLARMPY